MMSTQTSAPVWVSQIGPSPSSQRPSTTNSAVSRVGRHPPPPSSSAHRRGPCRHRATALRSANANRERSRRASWATPGRTGCSSGSTTDEGIHGFGEGTVNGFAATVAAAIEELHDAYLGLDPHDVELLLQRMVRDVYTDGGQIHMAAVAAIEIACWDIVGKAAGQPVHALLGGRVRDRVRVYANGWYRTDREPEAVAGAGPRGRRARLHGDEVRPVRDRVAGPGPARRGPLDRHRPGGARRGRARRRPDDRGPQPVHRLDRAPDRRPARRVPAGLARGARPPLADGLDGRGRAPIARPDRHRRELHLARPVRRPAVARRRPDPPARAAPPRRPLADPPGRLDGRGAPRGRRAAQRPGPGLRRDRRPAGRVHPELLRAGDLRRVQRRLDAVASSTADPPGRRLRRGPRRARPRHRARLGRPRGDTRTSASTSSACSARAGSAATTRRSEPA